MTGFEPATTRPPDVYSTGLSYIPKNDGAKVGEKIEICKCFGEKCVQKFESFLLGSFFFVFGDFFALGGRWRSGGIGLALSCGNGEMNELIRLVLNCGGGEIFCVKCL